MTVGASVAEPITTHRLATHRQARDKAADLMERVGLSADMANRYPHEFSGGQRQRIAIARALALDPKSSSPMKVCRRLTCPSRRRSAIC